MPSFWGSLLIVGGGYLVAKTAVEFIANVFSGDEDKQPRNPLPPPPNPPVYATDEQGPLRSDYSRRYESSSDPTPQPYSTPYDVETQPGYATQRESASRKASSSQYHPNHLIEPGWPAQNATQVQPKQPARARSPLSPSRAANTRRAAQQIPTTVQPLSKFLPIADRVGYDAARDEGRRLRDLKKKYTTKKRELVRSRLDDEADQYESALVAQAKAIEALDAQASAWIFNENNRKVRASSVDLHNLYVSEAIHYALVAIIEARAQGKPQIRLIVGRGRHADSGVSTLRPAIQEFLAVQDLDAEEEVGNPGALIVRLVQYESS